MTDEAQTGSNLFPGLLDKNFRADKQGRRKKKANAFEPPNLGKATRLPVPNFGNPDRHPVCLEVDFPILPINALSNLEGNAGKPIYQMSKWWARRRSSVFRSLLIASAVEAPDDPTKAAKLVWDHYYSNHQKAGRFKRLRVLDPFMGGGTTLVEGARLGFQMVGVDLNPVAWFVTRNELAASEPEQVRALFEHIEAEVKPRVQPLYTTTCPRGHKGRWYRRIGGQEAGGQKRWEEMPEGFDPIDLPTEQRKGYRWEGPEVIYTFWAKHGPCQARGCGHRTPIFRSPVIAEKKLTTYYIETTCPSCGHTFNVELGQTRMAPGAERVVLDSEPSFTETTQEFAALLKAYDRGNAQEKIERIARLQELVDDEPGLRCPRCGAFAGDPIKAVLERHGRARRASDRKKKDFGIQRRPIQMYLLIHPAWLEGAGGQKDRRTEGEKGKKLSFYPPDSCPPELGGYAGAPPDDTVTWFRKRLENLTLIEVRGEELPEEVRLQDGSVVSPREGTVPRKSHFTCAACGKQQDILGSVKPTGHTAPVAAYALQCHCPECEAEGYNYGGRYFKALDEYDLKRLERAEREWAERSEGDLKDFWPRQECWDAYMMRANGGVNEGWGYTHWWKMFNPRQLLVHTQLLQAITNASEEDWALDVREQLLGAFQQYLRMMCMFSFWHQTYDKLAPALSNANFHPKQLVVETNVVGKLGYGRWISCTETVLNALSWCHSPWELAITPESVKGNSVKVNPGDTVIAGVETYSASSTDLSIIGDEPFDLVITDPPFGDNLFYADLADFFYVWLRIPLLKWYEGLPERAYFEPERTPHAMEAVRNPVEHPDNREEWEKDPFVRKEHVEVVRRLSGDDAIQERDPNPLYRPEPASDFYRQTLTACWAEAGRLLKAGGLMAFTFHHSADAPWVDVLEALFNAGYLLVATYPIRSDETKGESGAFGSRKIEYDIIHVCRKRLKEPQPVSWARMRRWVKDEATRLKELLEHSHGKDLPEADLRVILRGKALEFYSRHYGQVYTGDGQVLSVRDALLGINQLLDDLLQGEGENGKRRPPDSAEPASRLFLHIFQGRTSMPRDELHKTLRGTGVSQGDLEALGWIRVVGTTVHVVPIAERFQYFTTPGRNRKVLKTDLDQAHFLIGAAMPGSGIDVTNELNRGSFNVKRSVDAILDWYTQIDPDDGVRRGAHLALDLLGHWRARLAKASKVRQMTLFDQLEAEEG
jgi:adenine-specific DNA methylase